MQTAKRATAPKFTHLDEDGEDAAEDDEDLEDVRPDDGLHAAERGVDGGADAEDEDAGLPREVGDRGEGHGGRVEDDADVDRALEDEDHGHDEAGRLGAVAELEVLVHRDQVQSGMRA